MNRLWRPGAAMLAFVALGSPISPAPLPPRPGPAVLTLAIAPVPLNPQDRGQDRVGRLRYLGGWDLRSPDRRLGGISAMHVENGRVTALSDAGDILQFALPQGNQSQVEAIPLLQGPGSPNRKVNRDTESMAIHEGNAWVAFEHHNQVWRYRTSDWFAQARAAPPAMDGWPTARGAEAMTRLPDGRFLIMSESLERDGSSPALLFTGDPTEPATRSMPVRFRPPAGYRITDVATLPDGRLLLVTRRVTWKLDFPVKLLIGQLPDRAGGEIAAQEIATLAPPLTSDNYEALSVTQEEGRTIVWLASDDNTTPLQRNLLLKFELVGEASAA